MHSCTKMSTQFGNLPGPQPASTRSHPQQLHNNTTVFDGMSLTEIVQCSVPGSCNKTSLDMASMVCNALRCGLCRPASSSIRGWNAQYSGITESRTALRLQKDSVPQLSSSTSASSPLRPLDEAASQSALPTPAQMHHIAIGSILAI